ncbi:hypothetical protein SBA2_240010 [Acidobacteriia bacterium SbA2]|nr:hypothetical protein SBA2_240010 [Acidobacteriia bacterium SbA2]
MILSVATTSLSEVVAKSKDLVFAYLSVGSSPCCFTTPEVGRSQDNGPRSEHVRGSFDSYGPRFAQATLRSG